MAGLDTTSIEGLARIYWKLIAKHQQLLAQLAETTFPLNPMSYDEPFIYDIPLSVAESLWKQFDEVCAMEEAVFSVIKDRCEKETL